MQHNSEPTRPKARVVSRDDPQSFFGRLEKRVVRFTENKFPVARYFYFVAGLGFVMVLILTLGVFAELGLIIGGIVLACLVAVILWYYGYMHRNPDKEAQSIHEKKKPYKKSVKPWWIPLYIWWIWQICAPIIRFVAGSLVLIFLLALIFYLVTSNNLIDRLQGLGSAHSSNEISTPIPSIVVAPVLTPLSQELPKADPLNVIQTNQTMFNTYTSLTNSINQLNNVVNSLDISGGVTYDLVIMRTGWSQIAINACNDLLRFQAAWWAMRDTTTYDLYYPAFTSLAKSCVSVNGNQAIVPGGNVIQADTTSLNRVLINEHVYKPEALDLQQQWDRINEAFEDFQLSTQQLKIDLSMSYPGDSSVLVMLDYAPLPPLAIERLKAVHDTFRLRLTPTATLVPTAVIIISTSTPVPPPVFIPPTPIPPPQPPMNQSGQGGNGQPPLAMNPGGQPYPQPPPGMNGPFDGQGVLGPPITHPYDPRCQLPGANCPAYDDAGNPIPTVMGRVYAAPQPESPMDGLEARGGRVIPPEEIEKNSSTANPSSNSWWDTLTGWLPGGSSSVAAPVGTPYAVENPQPAPPPSINSNAPVNIAGQQFPGSVLTVFQTIEGWSFTSGPDNGVNQANLAPGVTLIDTQSGAAFQPPQTITATIVGVFTNPSGGKVYIVNYNTQTLIVRAN
jgi:hypothetical protein